MRMQKTSFTTTTPPTSTGIDFEGLKKAGKIHIVLLGNKMVCNADTSPTLFIPTLDYSSVTIYIFEQNAARLHASMSFVQRSIHVLMLMAKATTRFARCAACGEFASAFIGIDGHVNKVGILRGTIMMPYCGMKQACARKIRSCMKHCFLSAITNTKHYHSHVPVCFHCGEKPGNLKYCPRCSWASYCNRSCQLNDWSDHKPFCDVSSHHVML